VRWREVRGENKTARRKGTYEEVDGTVQQLGEALGGILRLEFLFGVRVVGLDGVEEKSGLGALEVTPDVVGLEGTVGGVLGFGHGGRK